MLFEILIAFYEKGKIEEKILKELNNYKVQEIEKADLSKILKEIRSKKAEKKKIILIVKDDISNFLLTIETIKRQFEIPVIGINQKKYEIQPDDVPLIGYFSEGIEKQLKEIIKKYQQ